MLIPRRIDLDRIEEYPGRIKAFVEDLRKLYRITRVILFGSFARKDLRANIHEMSDIDLVVIGDVPGDFADRAVTLHELTRLPVEPWVYTDAEWKQMVRERRSFAEEVLATGIDL